MPHLNKTQVHQRIKSDSSDVRKVVVNEECVKIGFRSVPFDKGTFYFTSLSPTNITRGRKEMSDLKNQLVAERCSFDWYTHMPDGTVQKECFENGMMKNQSSHKTAVVIPSEVGKVDVLSTPTPTPTPVAEKGKYFEMGGFRLPINDHVHPSLVSYIPEDNGFILEPVLTARVMMLIAMKANIALVGHSGVGKTEMLKQIAFRTNNPFIMIPCSNDMESDSLIGYKTVEDGNVEWVNGLLSTGLERGAWVYADEWNVMNSDTASILHNVLDSSRCIILKDWKGEVIKAHEDFRFFASNNPASHPAYAGMKEQNSALLDRCEVLWMDYPTKEEERKIIESYYPINRTTITMLIEIANSVRSIFKRGDILSSISTRSLINISGMIKRMTDIGIDDTVAVDTAFSIFIGKIKSGEDAKSIRDQIKLRYSKLTMLDAEIAKRGDA